MNRVATPRPGRPGPEKWTGAMYVLLAVHLTTGWLPPSALDHVAALLGVRGVSVISHGKSSPRAIKNAIKVAAKTVESRMSDHIGRRLGEGNGAAGDSA